MIDQSITLCGNLTKDVEFSPGNDGGAVSRARFRLANNRSRFDAATNEWKDTDVVYIDVVCWRAMADNVGVSLRKGDPAVVVGRLRDSTWTDKEGVVHPRMEIDADVVAFDLRRSRVNRVRPMTRDAQPRDEFDTAQPGTGETDAYEVSVPAAREPELVGASAEAPF